MRSMADESASFTLSEVQAMAEAVRANIARVIVGKLDVIDLLLVALLSDGHILLEDVPGMGKTVMAMALARSIGAPFQRVQGTPDLLPTDITGVSYFDQRKGDFVFRQGPIFVQVLLVDEINRATPRRLLEDPLRVAGVREYVLGDDPRRIHWKATARAGELRSKIYEPSSRYRLLMLLDINSYPEPWMGLDSEIQELSIAAASLAL
jgi:ATPase family associated with various cellular activities (AAA)/Protein of unknown function DUF58